MPKTKPGNVLVLFCKRVYAVPAMHWRDILCMFAAGRPDDALQRMLDVSQSLGQPLDSDSLMDSLWASTLLARLDAEG